MMVSQLLSAEWVSAMMVASMMISSTCVLSNSNGLATPTEAEEQYATLSEEFQDIVEEMMGEELPDNLYDWNITAIVIRGEYTFGPTFWCDLDQSYFIQFPTELLEEMPDYIKWCHGWICLFTEEELNDEYNTSYSEQGVTVEECEGFTVSSNYTCPFPFIDMHSYSPYPGGCGVVCKYAGLLHGYRDSTMRSMRAWKLTCCLVSLIFVAIVFINFWLDYREKRELFCSKAIISQAGILIAVCYALSMSIFLIVDMVGVDNVLCDSNDEFQSVVSLYNPRAGWDPCTVSGSLFYLLTLMLSFYTALFSMALWDTLVHSMKGRPQWLRWLDHMEEYFERQSVGHISPKSTMNGNNHQNIQSESLIDSSKRCIFSGKIIPHLIVIGTSLIWLLFSLLNDVYDSYHPMGICYAAGNANAGKIFVYAFLPMCLAVCILIVFLPLTIYFLWKTMNGGSQSKKEMNHLRNFHIRLVMFLIGIVCSWMTIWMLTLETWARRKDVKQSGEDRLFCAVGNNFLDIDHCYDKGYRVPESLIAMLYFGCVMAIFSSMVLGCREKTLEQWEVWFPWLSGLLRCNCESFEENRKRLMAKGRSSMRLPRVPSKGSSKDSSRQSSGKQFESDTRDTQMDEDDDTLPGVELATNMERVMSVSEHDAVE